MVLQINTYKGTRCRSIDLHDLPIGDTWCHKLTGPDLFKELQRRGVTGIDKSHGWQQLATIWGNVLADKKEATK
jgi:hypothetical protein